MSRKFYNKTRRHQKVKKPTRPGDPWKPTGACGKTQPNPRRETSELKIGPVRRMRLAKRRIPVADGARDPNWNRKYRYSRTAWARSK